MAKQASKAHPSPAKRTRVTADTVRQFLLALPEVKEELSSGRPVWRVRTKPLAYLYQEDDSLLLKIDFFKRDVLLHAQPNIFYVTDFYRCHPFVFIRLAAIDRPLLSDLIEQAWRLVAPKRLIEHFDEPKQ